MILRSGVPIGNGLSMLASGRNSRSADYIFARMAEDVSHGKSLSSSLAKLPSVFGEFSVNIVRIGEASGTLHQNLEYLSEELKKKEALKKKVLSALVYPALIVVATLGIALVLTVYIFPKITPIFQSFKQGLPLSTRILIVVSGFLIRYGALLFLGVVAGSIGFFFLLKHKRVKQVLDAVVFSMPIFGKLSQYYNVANITRTMSLLLKADVGVVQSLTILASSTHSTVYQRELQTIKERVAKGQKLSAPMQRATKVFPPLCTQMLRVGEETGNLSESLMYLSDMYEEEINDLTKNLTTLLEPILMIAMGLVVGFIAVSIITPIYSITQNLAPH